MRQGRGRANRSAPTLIVRTTGFFIVIVARVVRVVRLGSPCTTSRGEDRLRGEECQRRL